MISVQRYWAEVRIAEEAVTVGEGVPCRLCVEVQVFGRVVREATEIEVFEDVQCLKSSDRTGRNRRARISS